MTPRRPNPAPVTLLAGAAILGITLAALRPASLATFAWAAAGAACVLILISTAGFVRDAFRARQFRRRIAAFLPAAPCDPALPWFVILTYDSSAAPAVKPARRAIFLRIPVSGAAPLPGPAPAILRALRAYRPRAPIAGVLLSLPADRLLTDTPAQTQAAAQVLAAALGSIRSALGLRFPVSVILTHCDCLRGFRELRAAVNSAEILGWSNPESLDSPVPLASFDEPIAHTAAALRRIRLSLLTDPPAGELPLRRADSLFALPDKVTLLAVPLRHLAHDLAPFHIRDARPSFFLRGLYLTSGPAFTRTLLHDKLLAERRLTCPQLRPARPHRHLAAVAAAALIAPLFTIAVLLGPSISSGVVGLVRTGPRAASASAAPPASQAKTLPTAPVQVPPPSNPDLSAPRLSTLAALRADATHALARARTLATRIQSDARDAIPQLAVQLASAPAAILAQADALAYTIPPEPLPSLPLSTPNHPAPRFDPRIARLLFADHAALASSFSPGDPSRRALTAAYDRYAADYIRAWSALPDPDIATLPWPQFRIALASIKPPPLNHDLRTLIDSSAAALAVVPSEFGHDPQIAAARAALLRDAAAIDRSWFDDACRRARDKWAALPPSGARSELLRLSRDRFQSDYLEIYSDPGAPPPSNRYWSSLILAALTSIADSSAPGSDAAEFLKNTRAFPLCSSSSKSLTPPELTAISDFASGLIRTGLSTAPADDSLPLSRGTRTDHPRINDQLARLIGEDAFASDSRDRWAYRIRAILSFLSTPQTCRLIILKPADQPPLDGTLPAPVLIPQFEILLGHAPPLGPFFTDRAQSTGISFDLPGPDLSLRFHTAPGQPQVPALDLPKPWNILTLLLSPGAIIDDSADPSGRLVKVPLLLTDSSGRRFTYWIGLRFDRPPPALAEWPSDADWPN